MKILLLLGIILLGCEESETACYKEKNCYNDCVRMWRVQHQFHVDCDAPKPAVFSHLEYDGKAWAEHECKNLNGEETYCLDEPEEGYMNEYQHCLDLIEYDLNRLGCERYSEIWDRFFLPFECADVGWCLFPA